MKINVPKYVTVLMQEIEKNGYECYIVGGAIRNILLNLPVHDWDLTTNALPEEMKQIFSSYKTIETGIQHGTLTILSEGNPVEITTYRKDSAYADHRHPTSVSFTTALQEDCARRDFTINALCYNESDGLRDFFDGQSDLAAGMIRCIGNAETRFEEDALRILRALRFAARLSFQIEESTAKALYTKKELLQFVSKERIREEWIGFLNTDAFVSLFENYREIFEEFLPELKVYDKAGWNNLLSSLKQIRHDPIVSMASILSVFNDSEAVGILRRLKYPNNEIREIREIIRHKEDSLHTLRDLRFVLSAVENTTFERLALYRTSRDASLSMHALQEMHETIAENHLVTKVGELAVNGRDIVSLGYKGKEIKDALQKVLDAVINEEIENKKEVIVNFLQKTAH